MIFPMLVEERIKPSGAEQKENQIVFTGVCYQSVNGFADIKCEMKICYLSSCSSFRRMESEI